MTNFSRTSKGAGLNHISLFFSFFSFLCHSAAYGVPGPGIRSEPQMQSTPQLPAATPDPLTHCARPGIEPASWLCGDTTSPAAPQWERPHKCIFKMKYLGRRHPHSGVSRPGGGGSHFVTWPDYTTGLAALSSQRLTPDSSLPCLQV